MSTYTPGNSTVDPVEAAAQQLFGSNKGFYLGPPLLGLVVDAMLCGVMLQQFFRWVLYSPADRRFERAIVFGAFAAAFAATAYSIVYTMHVFAYDFGTYKNFAETAWIRWFLVPDSIVDMLVRAFFAERAYRLTGHSRLFLLACGSLMLFCLATSIGAVVAFNLLTSTTQLPQLRTVVYIWIGASVGVDVFLTSTIMYQLLKCRTGEFEDTDRLVHRLAVVSLETQLPPTLVVIGMGISFTVNPSNMVNVFFLMILSKVYMCGMLGAINSRYSLRRELDDHNEQKTHRGARSKRLTPSAIHVATETYTESHYVKAPRVGRARLSEHDSYEAGDGAGLSVVPEWQEWSANRLHFADDESM
ncbi:hypothetical protein JCM24511_06403 [Saitozyma sp. JCM 24511]|nr:hypothetical protein JCM24511_06403 [Saitozyma sp. JCM 24511]